MLAVLCPGQGAQTAGFLDPWLAVDGVSTRLHRWSGLTGVDLAGVGSDPSADVVDTAVAQPLLVASGLAVAAALGPLPADTVLVGHSIGEVTAASIAGVLDEVAALTFARERGRAMAQAAGSQPSGMTALLGGDAGAVEQAVSSAGCWVANYNGAGQLVAGGGVDQLAALTAALPAGVRPRALAVAGAFHTPFMEPARKALVGGASWLPVGPARHPLVCNADGAVVTTGRDVLARLIAQVVRPVRFDRCLATLRELGVDAVVELAPGGVLTGLVRRALPEVTAIALRTPQDLDAARRLIAEHADVGEQFSPSWRVLVAPAAGTFHTGDARVGEVLDAPTPIGSVRNRSGERVVTVDRPARLVELLARDGDPVGEGQPLARLAPTSA